MTKEEFTATTEKVFGAFTAAIFNQPAFVGIYREADGKSRERFREIVVAVVAETVAENTEFQTQKI